MSASPERPARPRAHSAEIADEARAIRARMDQTLDEIEFRLSPGQLSGGVMEIVRDVMQGRDGPVTRAIRANPLPVLLIGLGFLWMAWEAAREPRLEGRRMEPGNGHGALPQRTRIVLTGLIEALRQGAERFRRVEAVIAEPAVAAPLLACAERLAGAADALDEDVRKAGGRIETGAPAHPIWADVDAVPLVAAEGRNLIGALEQGVDATLVLLRDAVREDLAPDQRVSIGARFHEVDIIRHEIMALREAVT